MKKLLTVALLALAVPTIAVANPGDLPLKRERVKYLHLYRAVRKHEGKRAPGRQILLHGVRHHHRVRTATAHEVAKSIRQLRVLLHPVLAAHAPSQPPAGVMTARVVGGPLASIRQCESGGNYQAVDPSGTYTGAFQFDDQTWHAMGGTGRAGDASPAEQDQRAAALYEQRGATPWPVCGRR